jgi:hypothetical protein
MTTPTSMHGLLASTLLTVLTDWCITRVDDDDDSKVDYVILGKPTGQLRSAKVVSIFMTHPLSLSRGGEEYVSGRSPEGTLGEEQWPEESWGGMRTESWEGAVQVNYRDKKSYDDAMDVIGPITTRITQAINQDSRFTGLRDDMGNMLSSIGTFRAEGVSSGGDNITVDRRWVSWRAFVHVRHGRIILS